MFYKYDFRNIGNKRVLYLYLSSSSEEANEFKNTENESIESKIKRFINKNDINYEEGPVYIISNGIIIKSIDIKKKNINIENTERNNIYKDDEFIVNIKHNENKTTKTTLRNYLIGALITNVYYDYDLELLKAIAVLYRTYIYKKVTEKESISTEDEFIKYRSHFFYKLSLYDKYNKIIKKIVKAIDDTNSVFITYNSAYINPYIHSNNNGLTDTKAGIDYLEKIPSLWDLLSPNYISTTKFSVKEIKKLLNISDNNLNIEILSLTDGNCINKIKIGNLILTGDELIKKLKLPSKDMTILSTENEVTFINRGYGHNLGLSLEGSKSLAKYGCNYLQILNYYFPKCKIKKYI